MILVGESKKMKLADNGKSSPSSSAMSSRSQQQQQQQNHHHQQLVSNMIKQGFISDHSLFRPTSLSPPPPPPPMNFRALQSPTSSPTLIQYMMSQDQQQQQPPKPGEAHHKKLQERVSELLSQVPFNNGNNNNNLWGMGDVRLTVAGKGDGETASFRVSMDVHRRVLGAKSRFFAEKLRRNSGTHSVEILDCDDVVVYVEAVVLMYCDGRDELRIRLMAMGEVSKVLAFLKISSAIMFTDGIRACLEYLEAVPWSEEEEEIVVSHLNQLHLDGIRTDDLLQRVTTEPSTSSRSDEIFLKLSLGVLQAKDDKARREVKSLICRLLKEDHDTKRSQNRLDISRDTLYHLCHRCLSSLILCLSGATSLDEGRQETGTFVRDIAREADNMQWIVDILIDRRMGDEFVKLWADQKELAVLHSNIPIMYRHEISKITAQLCICIGRGQVLVPKETRFALLSTWLEALYDDFRWIRFSGRSVDKKLIEEGLSQTILTLPLPQQQMILLSWFDRFLNHGDDCPNIQRAFEIWWRRVFVKQYVIEPQMQLAVYDIPN